MQFVFVLEYLWCHGFAFSALMLLVGWQERHPAHKNFCLWGVYCPKYPVGNTAYLMKGVLSCSVTMIRIGMIGDCKSRGQPPRPGLPQKWLLKWRVCVLDVIDLLTGCLWLLVCTLFMWILSQFLVLNLNNLFYRIYLILHFSVTLCILPQWVVILHPSPHFIYFSYGQIPVKYAKTVRTGWKLVNHILSTTQQLICLGFETVAHCDLFG